MIWHKCLKCETKNQCIIQVWDFQNSSALQWLSRVSNLILLPVPCTVDCYKLDSYGVSAFRCYHLAYKQKFCLKRESFLSHSELSDTWTNHRLMERSSTTPEDLFSDDVLHLKFNQNFEGWECYYSFNSAIAFLRYYWNLFDCLYMLLAARKFLSGFAQTGEIHRQGDVIGEPLFGAV